MASWSCLVIALFRQELNFHCSLLNNCKSFVPGSRTVPVPCAVVSITATGADSAEAVVHTEDGRMLLLDTDSGQLTPLTDPASGQDVKLPVPAEQVSTEYTPDLT